MANPIITNAENKHDLKLVRRSSAEKHLMIQTSLHRVTPFECRFALAFNSQERDFFGKPGPWLRALSNISFVHAISRAHLEPPFFLMSLLLVQR